MVRLIVSTRKKNVRVYTAFEYFHHYKNSSSEYFADFIIVKNQLNDFVVWMILSFKCSGELKYLHKDIAVNSLIL